MASDYIRRMARRNRSRVDEVCDVEMKDGSILRVKPSVMTDRKMRSSQEKEIRYAIRNAIDRFSGKNFENFVKEMLDGGLNREIYAMCKRVYPVKRVEICKSEVIEFPKIESGEKIGGIEEIEGGVKDEEKNEEKTGIEEMDLKKAD
jgi:small subunit ribosomal protein S3Ae